MTGIMLRLSAWSALSEHDRLRIPLRILRRRIARGRGPFSHHLPICPGPTKLRTENSHALIDNVSSSFE